MNYQDLRDADLEAAGNEAAWRVFVEGELVLETRDKVVMTDGKVRKWA